MPYPYYPNYMNPQSYLYPQQNQQPVVQNNSGINWVSGEAGAKAFLVGAGQSVLLMDAESDVLFLKSADQSGMPTIRKFRYVEEPFGAAVASAITSAENSKPKYVSHEEFEKYRAEIESRFSTINGSARE